MDLQIDQIFEEKYKIHKVLGAGGMGKVYLAENMNLGNYWAIKQVKKDPNKNFDLLAEPNIMKKLNHPSLPRIFDIIENDHYIYIILDYVDGKDLEDELKAQRKFPEEKVVEWAKQICNVFYYLHNQKPFPIIYRDMKPSNLMITEDEKIKVIDFGIAREFKQESKSDTTYLGTRGYAAPEQSDGTAQTDGRTDIYSLGVTLYHLVTGKGPNDPPYEFKPIREFDSSLSEGLEYIIAKCIKQDPNERYQTVKELYSDLTNIEKFSLAYKKERRKYILKVTGMTASLTFFSYLTFAGVQQFKGEQVYAYNEMVKKGTKALTDQNFPNAKKALTEAIKFKPKELSAYKEYGRALLLNEQYDDAIKYMQEKVLPNVEGSSQDSDVNYIIGSAFYELKDYQKANDYFKKSIKLAPQNVDYYRDLAVSYAKLGDFSNANGTFSKIKKLKLDEAVSDYVQGEINAAQEKFTPAVENYQKSIKTAKEDAIKRRAYVALASLYKDHPQELDDANASKRIASLEAAKSDLTNKNDITITESLGEAYYDRGRTENNNKEDYQKAIANFQYLIDSGYDRPYIYRNIAIIYQLEGHYQESEKTLVKMEQLYPADYTVYNQFALLYAEMENQKPIEQRNYQKTYDNYQLALKYSPDGENTPDLQPTVKLMNELKSKKWIK